MGQVNPVLRASVACALTLVGLLPHGPARAGPGFVPETKFSNLQLDDWEPSIAADDSGHVYWATTRYGGRKACKGCPDPAIVYRVSSDAGATWSERRYVCRCRGVGGQHDPVLTPPVATPSNRLYWFAGGLTVTPDGTAFSSQDAYPQNYEGGVSLYVQRSSDGGRTWDTIALDRSRQQPACPRWAGCPKAFLGPQIAIASDDVGRVYVLYNANEKKAAPTSLFLRWTDDNGKTWSLPRKLGRARGRIDHEFPTIAATGAGDVRIAWTDNRTGRWNTWYRRSTNGGDSWTERERLSNRAGGAPYKNERGFKFPYGDYGQLAIDGAGITHAIWGEGPSYVGPGGSWYTRALSPAP